MRAVVYLKITGESMVQSREILQILRVSYWTHSTVRNHTKIPDVSRLRARETPENPGREGFRFRTTRNSWIIQYFVI